MLPEIAQKVAVELEIDITQVIREEWEIKVLKALFDSPLGKKLVFKGGTALRLAYGSPRFSEDLDFDLTKTVKTGEFETVVQSIAKMYQGEVTVSDLKGKFYTLLAEFKIREAFLPTRFSIKIEISRRQGQPYQTSLMLLNSPTTNIQVLASVERLNDLYQDKIATYRHRQKPRDLFDLWFIGQKLKTPMPDGLPKIPYRTIRSELSRCLPRSFAPIVKQLEENYGS